MKILQLEDNDINLIGNALDALHRQTPIAQARPLLDLFDLICQQCKTQEKLINTIKDANNHQSTSAE